MKARSGPQGVVASTPAVDTVSLYPTLPWGGRAGAELIKRLDPQARSVWECAAGFHSMAHGLREYFDQVHTSDAFDYGLGDVLYDFCSDAPPPFEADWIVTNPPFHEDCIPTFITKGWARARRGLALLMRLGCVCGQTRYPLLYGPRGYTVQAPFIERIPILRGRCEPDGSTATEYAFFIFEKRKGGRPAIVLPFPPGTEARLTRPSDAAFAMREAS